MKWGDQSKIPEWTLNSFRSRWRNKLWRIRSLSLSLSLSHFFFFYPNEWKSLHFLRWWSVRSDSWRCRESKKTLTKVVSLLCEAFFFPLLPPLPPPSSFFLFFLVCLFFFAHLTLILTPFGIYFKSFPLVLLCWFRDFLGALLFDSVKMQLFEVISDHCEHLGQFKRTSKPSLSIFSPVFCFFHNSLLISSYAFSSEHLLSGPKILSLPLILFYIFNMKFLLHLVVLYFQVLFILRLKLPVSGIFFKEQKHNRELSKFRTETET